MREQLEKIKNKVDWLGTDLEDKDIELRDILRDILELLDQALPKEVESD